MHTNIYIYRYIISNEISLNFFALFNKKEHSCNSLNKTNVSPLFYLNIDVRRSIIQTTFEGWGLKSSIKVKYSLENCRKIRRRSR